MDVGMERYSKPKPRQAQKEHAPGPQPSKGFMGVLKNNFLHNPAKRRKMIIASIVYIACFIGFVVYIYLQASRVNAEVAVKQSATTLSSVSMPGVVMCHNPSLYHENFNFLSCNVFIPGCFMLPPGSVDFQSKLNSLELLLVTNIKDRIYKTSIIFYDFFDRLDDQGRPAGLGMPKLMGTSGTAFTTVKLEQRMGLYSTSYENIFTPYTTTIPTRHNYTLEIIEAEKNNHQGGVAMEFVDAWFVLESMTIFQYKAIFTYTLSDFFGQAGGIFGIFGTIIALILGKGSYNPYGLIHKAHIVPREEDMENVVDGTTL